MEYLNLSKEKTSNFMLSRIGLGSMRMGDVNEGISTIHRALDGGVNFQNTADFYGNGQSEMLIKEALKTRRREDVFISVKFGAMQGVDGRMYGMDARPEAVENYLRYTLSRLGTDYVDLYQPARINPHIPVEDTIGAISDLVKRGYVKNIGISEVNGDILRRANAVHPISLVEVRYSLADRHIEDELLPTARELGVGVVAFGVLLSGLIGGSSQEEKLKSIGQRISPEALDAMKTNLARADTLKEIADEKQATLAQLAIAWVLAQGEDIIALVGSRTASQIKDTIQALKVKLTKEDLNRIDRIMPKEQATSSYMLDVDIDAKGLFHPKH
ncbi:aldo/keto reductase [Bacteroides oleiciplenus]|uniref:aldo/keto reductase n=1 Tax=Bacteroides oleiciplenus TaxID=626931 RepID=UPI0026DD89B0|nr:aldo/keto reductase [Bacteroides oleiciplenus]